MKRIIRTACVAVLALLVVPQAAFGLMKPVAARHTDTAPVDRAPTVAQPATGSGTGSIEMGVPLASFPPLGKGAGGSNLISFTSLTDGDIVVVMDPSSVTGHAGMLDHSHYTGISSYAMLSANVTPVKGVQYEKCAKYRLYEWAFALRVSKEYAHRIAVRDYAAKQVGKPYSLLTSKTDLRSFYCSKLPWLAYHNVTGVDLDADGGYWVWPVDLLMSRNTTLIGYWG